MKVNFETNDLLSMSDAAKALGVTRITLYRWIDSGKIETVSFGGYRAVHIKEIERLKGERGINDRS